MAATKRKGLSKRKRFEVFKRDGFTCVYCGRKPPQVMLQADHVLAVAAGGGDETHNLVTSCSECNLGKSDRPLTDTLPCQLEEMERKVEIAEQTKGLNELLLQLRAEREEMAVRLGEHWMDQLMVDLFPDEVGRYGFTAGQLKNLQPFLDRLCEAEIMDAIDVTMNWKRGVDAVEADTWQYFYGVCWRKIKGDGRNG